MKPILLKPILLIGALLALIGCDRLSPSQDAPSSAQTVATVADGAEHATEAVVPTAEATDETGKLSVPKESPVSIASGQYKTQSRPLLNEPEPRARGSVYTPQAGSSERTELMNAIRETTRNDLGTQAVFVVHNLRSNGHLAFGQLYPQHPNGTPIKLESTPFYRANSDFPLDGLRIDVIWRKQGNRWQVYAHEIGATDVWYVAYCDRLPGAVIPGC